MFTKDSPVSYIIFRLKELILNMVNSSSLNDEQKKDLLAQCIDEISERD